MGALMAYDFNGTSATIDFGDVTFLNGLATFSCHLWANCDTTALRILVSKYTATEGDFRFYVDNGSSQVTNGVLVIYECGVDARADSGNGSVTAAAGWQSVGFSFEKTATGLKTRVGGTAGTAVNVSGAASVADVAGVLMVGARSDSTAFFDGQLAELAFWNRVLTDQEWTNLAAGQSPLLAAPSGLIFYARLNNDAVDEIGAITGTITNATPTTHPTITYPGSPAIAGVRDPMGGRIAQ
jgi:hypothetical protein